MHNVVVPFTSHNNMCNYAKPKPLSWAKLAYFGFYSSNFIVWDHISITIGDALNPQENFTLMQWKADLQKKTQ
jgi:hypothetical protein